MPSGSMSVDDLANRTASFVSTGVKDGIPVNGCGWNCRLSSFLNLSSARRICGVLH